MFVGIEKELAFFQNIARLARMGSVLLRNARIFDPSRDCDDVKGDLLMVDGKIEAVGTVDISSLSKDVEIVPCDGKVVCPGLIDMHVHLREPGQTHKETIKTATQAAASGGFTTVLAMPNSNPVLDTPGSVLFLSDRCKKDAVVNVLIAGALSKGLQGEEMAPIGGLKNAGVVALTDDGRSIQNNDLMRRILQYAQIFNLPVLDHPQDFSTSSDGVMHAGYWSTRLGLRGYPGVAEEIAVARNILLAKSTGARVHCQHIHSAESVRLIRQAKAEGVKITAETCPHYLSLTDAAIAGSEEFFAEDGKNFFEMLSPKKSPPRKPAWSRYNTFFKMNPPLGSAEDRAALIEGIQDGTLEVIASDHAPHASYEKEVEFDIAPFGIIGLESELAVTLMCLYHTKILDLKEVIKMFTVNPSKILGIEKGTLAIGADADVTVFDPDKEWIYDPDHGYSKGKNSPFAGWTLKGKAERVYVSGKQVVL